jgi:hypothetical protein
LASRLHSIARSSTLIRFAHESVLAVPGNGL